MPNDNTPSALSGATKMRQDEYCDEIASWIVETGWAEDAGWVNASGISMSIATYLRENRLMIVSSPAAEPQKSPSANPTASLGLESGAAEEEGSGSLPNNLADPWARYYRDAYRRALERERQLLIQLQELTTPADGHPVVEP